MMPKLQEKEEEQAPADILLLRDNNDLNLSRFAKQSLLNQDIKSWNSRTFTNQEIKQKTQPFSG